MKELLLKPQTPHENRLEIDVFDFPAGLEGNERKRCTISANFTNNDINELKKQGKDLNGALEWYKNDIHEMVSYLISKDWLCLGGMDESIALIREKISSNFDYK